MAVSTSSLVKQVAERHAAFSVWYHESKAATARLRQNHYAALTSPDTFEQIPAVYPGYLEEIRQLSVTIPQGDRGDKRGFCFDYIKMFLGCVDDDYGGDYLIGRSTQLDSPNVFVLRMLDCGHMVIVHLNQKIEGNILVVKVMYSGMDARVNCSNEFLGWDFTRFNGQLNWDRLNEISNKNNMMELSRGIVMAKISDNIILGNGEGNANVCGLVAAVIGAIIYGILNGDEGDFHRQGMAATAAGVGILIWILTKFRHYKRRETIRKRLVADSLNRNPSAFFTIFDRHQNLMQITAHQVFTQRMNEALDTAASRIVHNM